MLSTKDVNVSSGEGGGIPKVISPGNHKLKINNISLIQNNSYLKRNDAYHVLLSVETEPLENFEGFWIDKNNESLGRHEGQVGNVRASDWPYKDNVTNKGIEIKRDMQILKFIKNICKETDCEKWFDDADGKYETIEDFVQGFNEEAPFADKWLECCVAGSEYYKQNGYIGHNLWFAKYSQGTKGFAKADANEKVHVYNEDLHLKKAEKPEEVEEFDNTTDDSADNTEFAW